MKLKRYIVVTVILILTACNLFAQDGEAGQPGAFLRLGYGVKALGMGSAFTAIANDGSALFWNPAGLSQLKQTELTGMYSILSMDRQQNFVSISFPIKNVATFGIGWLQYGISDIDKRDESGNPIGTFSDNEMAVMFGLGSSIGSNFSYGASVKYLDHTIDESKSNGFGFDFGLLLHDIFHVFNIGAALQSFSSSLNWDDTDTKEEIPYVIKTGAGIKVPTFPLTLSFDYEMVEESTAKYHFGAQFDLFKGLALRAGYNYEYFTAGCSITVPIGNSQFEVDYAYDPMSTLDFSDHRIGVCYKF